MIFAFGRVAFATGAKAEKRGKCLDAASANAHAMLEIACALNSEALAHPRSPKISINSGW